MDELFDPARVPGEGARLDRLLDDAGYVEEREPVSRGRRIDHDQLVCILDIGGQRETQGAAVEVGDAGLVSMMLTQIVQ